MIFKRLIILVVFFYLDITWSAENNPPGEIQILKQQVKRLLKRVEQLEQQQKNTAKHKSAAKNDQQEKNPKKNDGLQWELGGYAKLDVVYSSDSAGANSIGDEFLVNGLIPVKNSSGEKGQLKITARESRLWLKTFLPFSGGSFKTHMEGDFFGNKPNSSETLNNNADFRLRQAYGVLDSQSYGEILLGQAWTTFQNLSAFPHSTTLGSMPGQVFSRVPQIRWTKYFEKWSAQLAVENPESNLRGTSNIVIRPDDDRFPDVIARVNLHEDWGDVSLAGLYRELRCDIPGICQDQQLAWGVSAAGRFLLSGKDNFRFQVHWGDGIGRFVSGTAYPGGLVDSQGDINTVEVRALMLSYQHWWNEKWNSALIYNFADAKGLASNTAAIEQLQTFNVNVMWWPLKRFRLGLEYIHAESVLANNEKGDLNRFIVSSKFLF